MFKKVFFRFSLPELLISSRRKFFSVVRGVSVVRGALKELKIKNYQFCILHFILTPLS